MLIVVPFFFFFFCLVIVAVVLCVVCCVKCRNVSQLIICDLVTFISTLCGVIVSV